MKADWGYGLFNVEGDEKHPVFEWLHVRPGDTVYIILGNKAPLWYWAHWVDGRMRPCPGENCGYCNAGIGKQRRWVFACVRTLSVKPMLWEVSDSIASDIRTFAERYDTVTNLELAVSRDNGGSKAKLRVSSRGLDTRERGSAIVYPEPSEALELTWTELRMRTEYSPGELTGTLERQVKGRGGESEY